MPAFMPLVSGNVYAFNAATSARRLWSVPATSRASNTWWSTKGNELPVMSLHAVRHATATAASRRSEGKGRILCLDRRNGRALVGRAKCTHPANQQRIIFRNRPATGQTNAISLTLPRTTPFTLQFTDDPVPPEPPYQARLGPAATFRLTLPSIPAMCCGHCGVPRQSLRRHRRTKACELQRRRLRLRRNKTLSTTKAHMIRFNSEPLDIARRTKTRSYYSPSGATIMMNALQP